MFGQEIANREPEHPNSGKFLRDIVFGTNDGVVTAIGFVMGFSGAVTQQNVVVIAGFLEVVSGAVSMALGNYLGVKSQKEFYEKMEEVEKWEIDNKPDVERKEIEEIYTNMGFGVKEVEILTNKVVSNRKMWLELMMHEELGLTNEGSANPFMAGVIIGAFFFLGGILPILPFIFLTPITRALISSIFVAIGVMILIGFFRWFLNRGSLGKKVGETVIIGLVAAFIGFVAGEVLKFFGFKV